MGQYIIHVTEGSSHSWYVEVIESVVFVCLSVCNHIFERLPYTCKEVINIRYSSYILICIIHIRWKELITVSIKRKYSLEKGLSTQNIGDPDQFQEVLMIAPQN